MQKKFEITNKIIERHNRIMTADLIISVTCPCCTHTQSRDLELTENIFRWTCGECKSIIESTIANIDPAILAVVGLEIGKLHGGIDMFWLDIKYKDSNAVTIGGNLEEILATIRKIMKNEMW